MSAAPVPIRQDATLEDEIDFSRYFRVFARHWILLLGAALVGGVLGFALSRTRPILYEGVTTVLILPPSTPNVRPTTTANFRALLENFTHVSQVVNELALDKPPFSLTPQAFHEQAMQIEEVAATNLVKVRVRLADAQKAMEASQRLAQKAVSLNTDITRREGSSVHDSLKARLDDASNQLEDAGSKLIKFQREAQVDLLRRDTDAMMYERGELLRLTIDIESEKARLNAAELEIAKQPPVLSIGRSVASEDALRRAVESDRDKSANAASESAQALDLSNPFINPVYQTLAFQIANSRSRLAALEQQRRQLVEVKKIGGRELKQLSDLYSREIELARLQTNYDVAKKVYGDLQLRYEQTRSESVENTGVLRVVDDAIPPDRPLSRQGARSAALGMVAGFMAAALAALALESRQPREKRVA